MFHTVYYKGFRILATPYGGKTLYTTLGCNGNQTTSLIAAKAQVTRHIRKFIKGDSNV